MAEFILSLLAAIRVFLRSRGDTALEVPALRYQIAVLKRKRPRPPLNCFDRLPWTTLRRSWSDWADVLVIVKPETVVGWHRAGFRLYWRWRSRRRGGRPRTTTEIRTLIRRLAEENPTWDAPKIHGELLKLGFKVSGRTAARYLRRVRRRGDPAKRWLAFLRNHREEIVALFNPEVITFLKTTGLKPKRTSLQAPWRNGTAERWAGSCRRAILDYVTAQNERNTLTDLRLRGLLPSGRRSRSARQGHPRAPPGRN